ncbi:MAG: hypothetical protein ABIS86_17970 [Streptosporangiaceae bacterium]
MPRLHNARLLRTRNGAHGYLAVLDFEDDAAFNAYTSSEAFRAGSAEVTAAQVFAKAMDEPCEHPC